MAGQADGSIIIDTELNSEGLKAGSAELLAALKSLTDEVKNIGAMLKEVFSKPLTPEVNTSDAEERVAALEDQVRELQALVDEMNSGQAQQTDPGANLGGAVQKASSLQKEIEAVNTSVEKLEPTFQKAMSGSESAMASFDGKATALESKIVELREKIDAVGQQKIPTEDYQWLTAEIEKADKELERLEEREDKMRATGVKHNSKAWQNLQYDIDLAKRKLADYTTDAANMEQDGTAFTMGVDTSQYQQLEATLSAATNRLAEMRDSTKQSESLMHRLASAAKKALGYVGAMAKKAGGALVSGLKQAAKGLLKITTGGKSANKQFSGLISSAKKFALSLLGAKGVYALLRKAISAYMSENQELQNKLNACWSGIGNLLGPIIERVINLVATAVSYVTSFLNLFGVFGGKAKNSAKAATGAAKELKNQMASFDELNIMGDKNKDSGDEQKSELPAVETPDWAKLMADRLKAGDWEAAAQILTSQLSGIIANADWAGIGNKAGYYIGGVLKFFSTAVKNFDWQDLGSNLGALISGVFRNIDWQDIGTLLVAKLSILLKLLTGFFGSIDGSKFGEDLYNLLYGAIHGTDWVGLTGELFKNLSNFIMGVDFVRLAQVLSEGIVTVLRSMSAAVTNFDWQGLGKKIADFINGIDWAGIIAQLVTLINDILKGALNLLVGLAENIDWAKLGSDLVDGIVSVFTNIDWGDIVSLVFELIGAALAGAVTLVVSLAKRFWEMLKNAWESTKSYFSRYIEEAGGNIIEGLLQGIWNAIKGIGVWIYDHIFKPFIDGFKNAFGIHSPSTVMAEMGGYLIQGLLSGIKALWDSVTGFFSNALSSLGNLISGAWESIKGAASSAWSGIKSVITTAWDGIKSGVSTAASAVGNSVSSAWNNVKSWTSDKWNSVKITLSSTWSSIKNTASTTWDNLKTTVSNGWEKIESNTSTVWSNVKSTLSSKWSEIKTTASTSWNNLKTTISNGWNNIKSTTSSTWNNIKSSLSSAWDSIKSTASSKWENIKNTIQNRGWSGVGSDICNGISRGIDSGWSWLKNKVGSVASSLLDKAKSALGIHSPSRLFRDQVGLNIGYGIGEGIEGSESSVLKSVTSLADAIAEEANAGDFSFGGVVPTAEVNGALTNFTDRITSSFTAMLDRLQAIAERVTFTVPAVANGLTVPYRVSAYSGVDRTAETQLSSITEMSDTVDERMADLSYKLDQLIAIVKALNLNIDIDALTRMITQQQRTNIRNFGGV